ncbi:tetratricopeptide repeat protein [Streptomyces mesophilus]|uniref:tetratricopeptide repeat protein n=1 Tax=Streptomyces mesophilus TaxID=1775132 RepID=UPI00332F1549
MHDNEGQFALPGDGRSAQLAIERAQALLRAGEFKAARTQAKDALEAFGPYPGLYAVLGRAHAGEDDDDHDEQAERSFRMGLVTFPDDLDLLAAYAEFGLAGDALDEPGRVSRGRAAAARIEELAPGSPQARELHRAGEPGTKWPEPATVQRYDARSALAGGVDVRTAAEHAERAAAAWPYDRRLAVRAETLAGLARPSALPARIMVRTPYTFALGAALFGAVIALGAPALHLPAPLAYSAVLVVLPALQQQYLLRRARVRARARLPIDYREPAPGAPDVPSATRRERWIGAVAALVAFGSVAGSAGWYAARAAEYPRYEASVPESYRGVPLSDGAEARAFTAKIDALPLPHGASAFSGAYLDVDNGKGVFLFAATGDLHSEDPDDLLSHMSSGFTALGEPTDSWSADPGDFGGRMECQVYESGLTALSLCVWIDKGSLGMVASGGKDGAREVMPRITRELRELTLRPISRGAV